MSSEVATPRIVCAGCGATVPPQTLHAFRCPAAQPGDDVDHVLRRVLAPSSIGFAGADTDSHPFVRYRERLHAFALARTNGLTDADFVGMVRRLDRAVAAIEGRERGLAVTPFVPSAELGERLGLGPGSVWIKDETGNVAGSHKVRHLFGLLLHLEVLERLGRGRPRTTPLAIASCGNAALAAAVFARAADRRIDVFVPPWANAGVVARLAALGARLVTCRRDENGEVGDPCYRRFHAALDTGALPFCCQGPDNGLTIEGGMTLAYEIVSTLIAEHGERPLDHLVVQVGGGALASACVQALQEALDAGLLERLPRVHAVQTAGAAPLPRAFERVRARAAESGLDEALRHAAAHRSQFMWPWEAEPRSIAEGILDDETYDWLAIVEGIARSGGTAIVVDETTLKHANELGRAATGIDASPTGTAGLAGLLELVRSGVVRPGERAAVLFTGVRR